ncbi:MAG: VOC family protein [Verrucomicrobia bacterium]|nr:VOC family protein [Verrucomicrobiota bacterium]
MPANLASFSVHADDVTRARRFYEAVFGWRFEPWGPPDFYLIHTGTDAQPGVMGLLHARMKPHNRDGFGGFECTFAVEDVDAVAAAVVQAGGLITLPKNSIPTVGDLIRFRDPEGNEVGAMRYEQRPRGA